MMYAVVAFACTGLGYFLGQRLGLDRVYLDGYRRGYLNGYAWQIDAGKIDPRVWPHKAP